MKMRTEIWSGHRIRFVEIKPGDWWAVLDDIASAMDIGQTAPLKRRLPADVISNHMVESGNGKRKMLIVNEFGIYETVFESRKKEAKDFKRWVFEMLKKLREASGLEGFEIFRMMDKDFQKQQMAELDRGVDRAKRKHYLKANTITNKCISTLHGYPKMLKKKQMTPDMLKQREPILRDTVDLMIVKERFKLDDLRVSKAIYRKYGDGS